jgi:pimeloyl-ACP methyl ester carboxylesterase
LLFGPAQEAKNSDLALLCIHGTAMNFYLGPLPTLALALASQDHHAFTMNTRGHDWIARAGKDLTSFGGAAYENLEDCLNDIDAALVLLGDKGYGRFVLIGHSLGAVKSLFYQGMRHRRDIIGVICCSAPRQFYSARAVEQPEFPKRMAEAETMLEQGRGEDFLWAPSSGAAGIFTARTYVSKYGSHEKTDLRPYAARLKCPLLTIAGEAERPFFPTYARELAEATTKQQGLCKIIDGADHFYRGQEVILTSIVANWLRETIR